LKLTSVHRACHRALIALSIAALVACGGGGAPTQTLSIQATGIKTLELSWPDTAGESGYRLLFTAPGAQGAELVATLPANTTRHTLQGVFLPAQANGRYTVQACEPRDTGLECLDSASAVVTPTLLNAAIGYFKAPDPTTLRMGYAIALSRDGRTMAIGTPEEHSAATGIDGNLHNTSAPNSGAVFVYVRGASGWVQQAYVKASNTQADDRFGRSLALSADGNLLAVGARSEDSSAIGVNGDGSDDASDGAGAAYLFERNGTQWAQTAYLKASNNREGANFGHAVALAADGNTLAVGAWRESSGARGINGDEADTAAEDAGAAYVFIRHGGGWQQQAYIKASNTDAEDRFGHALALSGDGDTLVVSAIREDSAAQGVDGDQVDNTVEDAGAAYVFTRSGSGWRQHAYLKASGTGTGALFGGFGRAVALSRDGQTLAVSAEASGLNGSDDGAVYVFIRTAASWSEQAVATTSATYRDGFGAAVSLSDDGNTLAVGATEEGSASAGLGGETGDRSAPAAGAVYLLRRSGSGWGAPGYLKASNPDSFDLFGGAIALAGDGTTLAVGAEEEDSAATGIGGNQSDNSARERGAVYLY
jgi:hypothetical protein